MSQLPQISTEHTDTDHCILTFTLDPKLSYFEGHFPGQPILAGVVQLDWAIKLAKQYLSLDEGDVGAVEVLKFQQMLLPNTEVTLTLNRKDPKKFIFSYSSASGNHASGRIKLI